MKHEKIDAVQVCKELEDVLAPRLKLSVLDRAVYLHLLRHSRFEGKLRLRFTIVWLANNMCVTARRVRQAVRRLVDNNVLRLIERSNIGHLVQVRSPGEVRAPRGSRTATGGRDKLHGRVNLDEVDFLRSPALRQAIHAREGWRVLLLSAPDPQPRPLPGSCGAGREVWRQFVPQPGFLLPGLQLAEEGPSGRGFSAPALPRGALVGQGPQRTPARRAGARGRQAAATGFPWGGCRKSAIWVETGGSCRG